MFDIAYSRSAQKALDRLDAVLNRRIRERIKQVAGDPFGANPQVKPLRGIADGYRLRVGDWRVSYRIHRDTRLLEVFEVASRGGAYR